MPRHAAVIDSLKQQLARALCATVAGYSLPEAINALRLDPADISRLRANRLQPFSVTRLLRLIVTRGYDVEVQLKPRPRPEVIRRQPSANVTIVDQFGRPLPD